MPEELGGARSAVAAEAERMRTRALDAGRWFAGYVAVIGIVSAAWIVVLETVFTEGLVRIAISAAWSVFIVLASRWADRHEVYPAGATRQVLLASALWFGAYLLLVGPLVRWQFGGSVLAWMLAAALMSSPFFVVAGQVLKRR